MVEAVSAEMTRTVASVTFTLTAAAMLVAGHMGEYYDGGRPGERSDSSNCEGPPLPLWPLWMGGVAGSCALLLLLLCLHDVSTDNVLSMTRSALISKEQETIPVLAHPHRGDHRLYT